MEKESWNYSNSTLGIQINKISNLFSNRDITVEGDRTKGRVLLNQRKMKMKSRDPGVK